ncbi:hypothetical protein FRC03_011583 [Tulasnella sp. 419]|nr:hypothetical protein FRC03_011583 [Tulasnella sp. 419]
MNRPLCCSFEPLPLLLKERPELLPFQVAQIAQSYRTDPYPCIGIKSLASSGMPPISTAALAEAFTILFSNLRHDDTAASHKGHATMHRQLDDEVADFQTVLSAFTGYIHLRLKDVRQRRNELAPIHSLPVEVFQTLFQLHVADHYDTSKIVAEAEDAMAPRGYAPQYMDSEKTPAEMADRATRQIAMVCNHWYDMVVSTPQLWSYLDGKQNIETTSLRLRRSGASPLHIFCPHIYESHRQRFMEVIIPHAYRWKSFIAIGLYPKLFENVDIQLYSTPLLEQLVLPTYDPVRGQLPDGILERSPNLRELHIGALHYPPGLSTLSGLTNLSVGTGDTTQGISMQQWEQLFSACPKLQTIFLRGNVPYHAQYTPFRTELPNLKSVVLSEVWSVLSIPILLSIFPKSGLIPAVKLIGAFGEPEHNFSTTLQDVSRVNSLLVLMLSSMTWISISSHPNSRLMEVRGGDVTLGMDRTFFVFEFTPKGFIHLIPQLVNTTIAFMLRNMVLELGFGISILQLHLTMQLHPDIDHLTFVIDDVNLLDEFIAKLSPAADSSMETPPPYRKLKTLTFKRLMELQPILNLLEARYGTWPSAAIESGQLVPLEKLELHYIRGAESGCNRSTKRKLESFLQQRNIVFEWVQHADT